MKIMAIDYGDAHTGVAFSDPTGFLTGTTTTIHSRSADVVLIDTAGRLHNKQNLMNELNKISRVVDRELPGCARETLLVLDATTGQNGLIQAKQFQQAAGITGIVLTKLDGTAKGGIVIAQKDFSPTALAAVLNDLLEDPAVLKTMAENTAKFAITDAAVRLADLIENKIIIPAAKRPAEK